MPLFSRPPPGALSWFVGLSLLLPAIGGGDALARAAHDLSPPRIQALRRTSVLILVFLVGTVASVYMFGWLVPPDEQSLWMQAPLAGLAQHLAAPAWLSGFLTLALVVAAALLLVPAARAALDDAGLLLQRLSAEGPLADSLAALHSRFGTPSRAINATAAAAVLVIVVSGGQVSWLARAYAMVIVVTLVLKIAALMRLRSMRPGARAFAVPLTLRAGALTAPIGLLIPGLIAVACGLAMVLTGDVPSLSTLAVLAGSAVLFLGTAPDAAPSEDQAGFDFLPAAELSLGHMDARPGNLLVPVRNPNALNHVAGALKSSGDRDVVVMTVRLLGIDVSEDAFGDQTSTSAERKLLTEVVALAERYGRPVRLLVVPARNVFDAIVATILRIGSSEVHVGESQTLTSDDQARLLGTAWERASKPERLDVRLVVHHRSGRADTYHLGAHPPSLAPADLDLLHRLWLDATSSIGPHVHHHDVVRAALTQMDQQLNGPQRDEGLAAIRQVARLSDELAEVLRARDYARLRDMMRNRHAGDLAARLAELPVEDQVVVFRVLPRGRRGGRVRVPVTGRQGGAAQGHGPGRRRRPPQQHGARRTDDVPRRTAGLGDAAVS